MYFVGHTTTQANLGNVCNEQSYAVTLKQYWQTKNE